MSEYHKIENVWKRDMANGGKSLIEGQWTIPEFGYLANLDWQWTEKVDGTNIRVMFDGTLRFGGKTDNAQMPVPLMERLQSLFSVDALKAVFDVKPETPAVLYGEGYGGKIQKGSKYRPTQDFVLFDVRVGHVWLNRESVLEIATALNLDIVPIVGIGTLHDAISYVRGNPKSQWGDFTAEGIVARPGTELLTRLGRRIITKIKCVDFP